MMHRDDLTNKIIAYDNIIIILSVEDSKLCFITF